MALQNTSPPVRLFLLVISLTIFLGIYLTGFKDVHWVLYLPAAFLLFAAATGICPGLMFTSKLLGNKS